MDRQGAEAPLSADGSKDLRRSDLADIGEDRRLGIAVFGGVVSL